MTTAPALALPEMTTAKPTSRRKPRRRWLWAVFAVAYVAAWGAAGLLPTGPTDLEVFFWPGALDAASGHPFTVYHLRYQVSYPNANGPVSLFPLTLVALLARAVGVADNFGLRRVLILAAFAVFPLLLAHEALKAYTRLTGKRVSGFWAVAAALLFLAAPTLWQGLLGYGHIELALMIWLLLLAVRQLDEGRSWLVGVLLGLAILTRASAVVYCLPLALLAWRQLGWRSVAWLITAGAATVAIILAPFLVADEPDTVFSLAGFHALLPVGSMTLSTLLLGTRWGDLVMRYDSVAVVVCAALVAMVSLAVRRDLTTRSPDAYALLAACGLVFPLLIKTLWPYYFYECYVLLVIWWLAHAPAAVPRQARWRWAIAFLLPASLVALGLVGDYILSLTVSMHLPTWWGRPVAMGTLTALAVLVAILCLSRRSASQEPASPMREPVALYS